MAARWLTLIQIPLFLQAFGIFEGAQKINSCKTDCKCCAGAQDGSRNLSTICGGKSDTACKIGCKDGFFGNRCYLKCPDYCIKCAREFGSKLHPDDYQICHKCADGFYNSAGVTNCSTPCPKNCVNNQCDKSTGHCLSGCKTIGMTGNKCNQCSTGYFGVNCEPCPEYCNNGTCDKQDGICTDGCKGNHVGSKCEKCMDFLFGENCKKVCPRCLNGHCDRITGICEDCWDGYYTQYCNVTCSSGCKNMLCYRYNGTCTLGCKEGYLGEKSKCSNHNPDPGINIAIGVSSAALAVVLLSFIIIILYIINARRWRNNFKQQFRGPSNSISYINTLFHLASEDTANTPVKDDSIEAQSQYEKLKDNRNTYLHAYDQVQAESSDQ